MKRDPHFQDILDGLSKPLDPDTFEACAASTPVLCRCQAATTLALTA
jgi:hypothetical protein